MKKLSKLNKRAQVSTTISWIVATIAIIVILAISMFLTTLFGKRIYVDDNLQEGTDLLVTKSFLSYLITRDTSGKTIFEQIKEEDKISDNNKEFSRKIFDILYGEEYPFKILLSLNFIQIGKKEYAVSISSFGGVIPTAIERLEFEKDKWVEVNTVRR